MEKSNRMKSLEGKSMRDLILLERYITSKKKELNEYDYINEKWHVMPINKAVNELYTESLADIQEAIINAAFNEY